jgi:hypothetical protein
VIEWLDRIPEVEPRQITVELPDGEGWVRVAWSEGKVRVQVEAALPTWWLDELENALAERGFDLHPDSGGGGQPRPEDSLDSSPARPRRSRSMGEPNGVLL